MFSRFRVVLGLVLLFALAFAVPVFAGGWAVITLDTLPSNVTAGKPLSVGFTVLQHGRTPMTDLRPTITAELSATEKMVVDAHAEGKPGHYAATLTFPQEGQWEWSIQAFTMDQPMPGLNVATSTAASPSATSAPLPTMLIIRTLALGFGLLGLAVALRSKSRYAMALTTLCLLTALASFMLGADGTSGVRAQSQPPSHISQVAYGRQLFLAKGCITCHTNSRAATSSDYWTIDAGAPNLSNFSASAEVLRLRLKDPILVKSDTKMPNLNLSQAEIEALIAFINSN